MIDKTKQIKGKKLFREESDYGNVGSDQKSIFRISVLDTTKTLSYIQWKMRIYSTRSLSRHFLIQS